MRFYMEIELKYRLNGEGDGLKIFEDFKGKTQIIEGSIKDTELYSAYLDTQDRALEKNMAAFRIRKRETEYEATLKWGGGVSQGLHERKEINLPVEKSFQLNPDIGVFKNIEPPIEFLDSVKGQLVKTVETKFNRLSWRIQDGDTILEFCFDRGMIIAGEKKDPILELEVELIEGDRSKLESCGDKLADIYGLEPEMRSKYERGLRLKRDI